MYKSKFIVILCVCAGSFASAQGFVFSSSFNPKNAEIICRDLKQNLSLGDDPVLENLLQVSDLSDLTLRNWLGERLKFIMGADETASDRVINLGSYNYQSPGIFPPEVIKAPELKDIDPPHGTLVASNIGATLYYRGKFLNTLYGFKFPTRQGDIVVKINSPRAGIARLGTGFFEIVPDKNPDSLVNKWFRISVLFEMARHADGSGSSLGFPHAVCPTRHSYGGYSACDNEANGASAIAAHLLMQTRKTCISNNSCTLREAAELLALAVDQQSRILNGKFSDPQPEGAL